MERRVAKLEADNDNQKELLRDIDKKLTDLSDQFLKHKGFIGGVIFTVSSLWALLLVGVDFLWRGR